MPPHESEFPMLSGGVGQKLGRGSRVGRKQALTREARITRMLNVYHQPQLPIDQLSSPNLF